MSNEQFSVKQAVQDEKLSNIEASNLRIEHRLDKLNALEKTMAEIVASNNFMHQKYVDVEHISAQNESKQKEENALIWKEHNELSKKLGQAHGMAIASIFFISAISAVYYPRIETLYLYAGNNKDLNTTQTQQIQNLHDRIDREVKGK